MHIILVKKKQSVKQRNRQISGRSGPILLGPVIWPDPVNTRTPFLDIVKLSFKGQSDYRRIPQDP